MEFTYTKINKHNGNSVYKIEVAYEHGDADITTHDTYDVGTESELQDFIEKFNIAQEAISDNRSYGSEIDKEIEETSWFEGLGMIDKIFGEGQRNNPRL